MKKKIAAIYRISSANGKSYVGSSVNVENRLYVHRRQLNAGCHPNIKLQRAWDKFGEEYFAFSLIEVVSDVETLLLREQYWIDFLNAVNDGYNIVPKAGSNLGAKHSKETRDAMSIARKGRKQSAEVIENRAKVLRGKKRPAEAIEATAAARRGKPISEEQKKKISDALKGRTVPSDVISKRVEKLRGKKCSDEKRLKISLAQKGRVFTEEHKRKLSEAQRLRFNTKA